MAVSIVMPALEMAQETGKLLSWRKQEGDSVSKGEPLLEIETDKVVLDLEAPADGVLAGVESRNGDVVPVGQIIAWIVAPGEKPPAESETAAVPAARAMSEQSRAAAAAASAAAPQKAAAVPEPKISPKARKMAQEHGVDIRTIQGTGPSGAITGDDVLRAAQSNAAAPAAAP